MQLIHDPRAHLHQPMPVPQQLSQIPILRTRYPDLRKVISRISRSSSRASSRSDFCFFTRLVLISAGSPIHTSKPNSANSRSNQREYPVATIALRTQIPDYCSYLL